MFPHVLCFTDMKGEPLYLATRQISAICRDTYSLSHGKATAVWCGGRIHYVSEDLGPAVVKWEDALQSIAAIGRVVGPAVAYAANAHDAS